MTTAISLVDQLACARRELRMRRNVYPRWVADKRMREETAALEIARMEAIVATLEGLAPPAPKQEALFAP